MGIRNTVEISRLEAESLAYKKTLNLIEAEIKNNISKLCNEDLEEILLEPYDGYVINDKYELCRRNLIHHEYGQADLFLGILPTSALSRSRIKKLLKEDK